MSNFASNGKCVSGRLTMQASRRITRMLQFMIEKCTRLLNKRRGMHKWHEHSTIGRYLICHPTDRPAARSEFLLRLSDNSLKVTANLSLLKYWSVARLFTFLFCDVVQWIRCSVQETVATRHLKKIATKHRTPTRRTQAAVHNSFGHSPAHHLGRLTGDG